MKSSQQSPFSSGIWFVLVSALGFSLMSACVKGSHNYGIPVIEIVAARALVSLLISYLDVKRKKISVWGNHKSLLFARGAVGTLALMCVYYAVTTLPLAEATILQYVHPIFTALLAVLFLKERVQSATLICIVLCFLGLGFILQPTLNHPSVSEISLFSVFIAILGAFGSSIAYVIVKKLSRAEDSSVIIFYFPLVALPVSVVLLFFGEGFVWPDLKLTILLIFVGIFTQIGQYGLTKAMQTLDAGKVSAFSYIQIVISMVIGIIAFGELPTFWTYLGGLLIVAGALINVFGRRLIKSRP